MLRHVVVAGGGIGGLTFAAAARAAGVPRVTVLEREADVVRANLGSGLGLWPPSQAAMALLGLSEELEIAGHYMTSPSYRDRWGNVLAQPSASFGQVCPVLCIHRDRLMAVLHRACVDAGVEIRSGAAVTGYTVRPTSIHSQHANREGTAAGGDSDHSVLRSPVEVTLSDHTTVAADMLVGADGIHSRVRRQLLGPDALAHDAAHCGYVYYRATVPTTMLADGVTDVQWHAHSFEGWGSGLRFGYVPLGPPDTFWFASVPLGTPGVAVERGARTAGEDGKELLLRMFEGWRGPSNLSISDLIRATPGDTILRTDISKVPNVASFDWHGEQGRVVLLGDACHATAPNIAQGAGLSIEDAIDLASRLRAVHVPADLAQAAEEYQRARKPRAVTVQRLADTVAMVGQVSNPISITVRNTAMKLSRMLAPSLQERIFLATVSHSLGGSRSSFAWELPTGATTLQTTPPAAVCERFNLLARVIGRAAFTSLPQHYRDFRSDPTGGQGSGTVTVRRGDGLLTSVVGRMLGLPPVMDKQPFRAGVDSHGVWTRAFGSGVDTAYFSTSHGVARYLAAPQGEVLTEGVGGMLDSILRLGYMVRMARTHQDDADGSSGGGDDDVAVESQSTGMWIGRVKVPLPTWLQPSSRWTETLRSGGWDFDGTIALPAILGGGSIMQYRGSFNVDAKPPAFRRTSTSSDSPRHSPPQRVIVTGGTGLLGTALCHKLGRANREIEIVVVSRNPTSATLPRGVVAAGWNQLPALLDHDDVCVVNLAGENPGSSRWSDAIMRKIGDSRLDAIAAVATAIANAPRKPRAWLQASAVGIYGDRGDTVLDEDAPVPAMDTTTTSGWSSDGRTFRIQCCEAIEQSVEAAVRGQRQTRVTQLRIGLLLAAGQGLLPSLELAAACCTARLGTGDQWVPWIHINDAAGAIADLVQDRTDAAAGVFNIVAPNPVRNEDMMRTLASRRHTVPLMPVPAFALRAVSGEANVVVLDSARVAPSRLEARGFAWEHANLEDALGSWECNVPMLSFFDLVRSALPRQ